MHNSGTKAAQTSVLRAAKERRGQDLGTRLIEIQDNWDSYKEDVARKPDNYLFLLEEFFGESRP